MKPITVLLVDENQLLSDMVKRVLIRNEYLVSSCNTLVEAQHIIDEDSPRIIIVVIDGFGYQVHDFIKTNKKRATHGKFIMISSFDNEVEILKSGADDWLRKPYNLTVLLTRLEVLCRES